MTARAEAAAKAVFDVRDDPYDLSEWEDIDATEREPYECAARAALAAADAVMFDDAAVERAARMLCSANNLGLDYWERYPDDSLIKGKFRGQARAVIAALKGDRS